MLQIRYNLVIVCELGPFKIERIRGAFRTRQLQALFITVDAPQLKEEKDMRNKFTENANVQKDDDVDRSEGVAKAISAFIDPSLSWSDIPGLRVYQHAIILKGVACGLDAVEGISMVSKE